MTMNNELLDHINKQIKSVEIDIHDRQELYDNHKKLCDSYLQEIATDKARLETLQDIKNKIKYQSDVTMSKNDKKDVSKKILRKMNMVQL